MFLISLITGDYYKGYTTNVKRRIKEHNSGRVVSTKSKIPYELIFVQICRSRIKARKLEKYLKSGFGREIIKEMV